ncbi:acyl-CoA thioesterase [Stieleria sp. TO1_6]|uniref:acyl-CoA thioesterase n=1 Tax=Stieleria tagensis TaxID=2956795 RepID=UPI00209A883E|nr:thioesterase family protein [Stieleria tagensis]MCO8124531.1 acyl-CoA thioesterase [Stieleria tagensis]
MSFRTGRRVEFRDTDAAGIAHFSAFFPWMESAEHEMLRSVEIPVLPDQSSDPDAVSWPRVRASCDYTSAVRFEDLLNIDVSVSKIGRSSVQYSFDFSRRGSEGDSAPVASGSTVVVCCRIHPGGGLEKVVIPAAIRAKLESLLQ